MDTDDESSIDQSKNLTDFDFKEFLLGYEPKTFLIGAGCSIDPPASLAAGREMMVALIKHICLEDEIEKILKLDDLRFEGVVEIVRDFIDPELSLIDYYEESTNPNYQHFFLADRIKQGHFVLTTNFDFLIEEALIQLQVANQDILPVITKEDFIENSDPESLCMLGKCPIYKIHGSTKNYITGKNTRNSLITTLQAFGRYKEGMNVFQVEPYKKELFENVSKNRSLIIMGYSGSDDFDIIPTLRTKTILANLKNIFWVRHIENDDSEAKVYEIKPALDDRVFTLKGDKVSFFLYNVKFRQHSLNVYKVDVNVSLFASNLINKPKKPIQSTARYNPAEWLKNHLPTPTKLDKALISINIYMGFGNYLDARRCAEGILPHAEETKDQQKIFELKNGLGLIHRKLGNYEIAIEYYSEALKIANDLDNIFDQLTIKINISSVLYSQGYLDVALNENQELLKFSKRLYEEIQDETLLEIIGQAENNIGNILMIRGNYDDALERYQEALSAKEQLVDLVGKATCLNLIGEIYFLQDEYDKAFEKVKEAYRISYELGYPEGEVRSGYHIGRILNIQDKLEAARSWLVGTLRIAKRIMNENMIGEIMYQIGSVNEKLRNFGEAIDYYKNALESFVKQKNTGGVRDVIKNLGFMFVNLGFYDEMNKLFQSILPTFESLEDGEDKFVFFNLIGQLYYEQYQYTEALDWYKRACAIGNKLGNKLMMAACFGNIGTICNSVERYDKALEQFQEALEIFREINNKPGLMKVQSNMSSTLRKQNKLVKALKLAKEAYKLSKEVNDPSIEFPLLNTIGLIYLDLKDYSNALKYLRKARRLGNSVKNPFKIAILLKNFGLVFTRKGNYRKAVRWYEEALQVLSDKPNSIVKVYILMEYAQVLVYRNQIDEAITALEDALAILQLIGWETSELVSNIKQSIENLRKELEK
ncbi:MAG: tetratricopeptide repeat protein [Candidatus Helarchaeota archaeon]|nr:tetratricopeptide repeat protein [Candidatus Helarchaeota archaeon]